MAKEFARKFYNYKAWKDCRQAYISIRVQTDGGLCEHCGKDTGNLGYIVDHITELTPKNISDPNISLNHNNLQYLCLKCHNTKTFSKNTKKPRYRFVNGELILLRDSE